MRLRTFLFAVLIMSAVTTQAQISFFKTYGDSNNLNAYDIKTTGDNGFIVTGARYNGSDWLTQDIVLIKLDVFGDTLWTKLFAGDSADAAYAVVEIPDGGYYVGAQSNSAGAGDLDVY